MLELSDLDPNPVKQFSIWFEQAKLIPNINYPEAFCLSTVDIDGTPNGRTLLLKAFGEEGFLFFSNCNSVKGKGMAKLPEASITFYWDTIARQVRIKGKIKIINDAEADNYYSKRPRLHQLGSAASLQSEVMSSRVDLENKIEELDLLYPGKNIPRPSFWLGYSLIPEKFEFWQQRPDSGRMNDRYGYFKKGVNAWEIKALYP